MSALLFSASLRFLSTVVNLLIAAFMAAKNAISRRSATASSSVPQSENALPTAVIVQETGLAVLLAQMCSAEGTSSGIAPVSNAL
ncbi:MAG: hypothetical protein R3E42_14850 [Burkholderiaceae bacterium]